MGIVFLKYLLLLFQFQSNFNLILCLHAGQNISVELYYHNIYDYIIIISIIIIKNISSSLHKSINFKRCATLFLQNKQNHILQERLE